MKKYLPQIIGGIMGFLIVGSMCYAINITVPAAPTSGMTLISTSTGQYIATTTDPFHVGSIYATSTSEINYFAGNLGVGTTTPGSLLAVGNNLNFSGNATSSGQFGFNITSGCFAINGVCMANGTLTSITAGTGLTGGTITTSGTIALSVPVSIANGGTNQTSFGTSNGIVAFDGTRFNNFSGYTLTGSLLSATNATSTLLTATTELNIPNGATVPTLSVGDIEQNTNSTASSSIQTSESPLFNVHSVSTVVASSTLGYIGNFGASGTTTLPVTNSLHTVTIKSFGCTTDVGTAWVAFGTGSATTTAVQCNSTGKFITVSANNVFKGRQLIKMDVGTSASNPNTITVTADVEDSN